MKKINKWDAVWGYSASILNVGAGLILLPVILHYLSPEDVGLWFVFITLGSLAQLLELGFQPTLARNIAYVYAGANKLSKKDLPIINSIVSNNENVLLDNLVLAARSVYKRVTLLASFVLYIGGGLYISTVLTTGQDYGMCALAWVAFSSGYIASFYFGYMNGVLQGRGDVALANKVIVFTRGSFIVIGSLSVVLGFGILGLGISSMLAAIIGRATASYYFHQKNKVTTLTQHSLNSIGELREMLWHNASRLGIVQVGAFFIQKSNILIASSFVGLAQAASYSLTVTVFTALSSFSMVICQIQIPRMNYLQVNNEKAVLKKIYANIVLLSWSVFIFSLILLVVFGSQFMHLIGAKTELLPLSMLVLLGIVALLEMNHSLAATYLTTTNKVPFVNSAIISGLAIVLLSTLTVDEYGILGLIISQGLVQLVYNNWKWPVEAGKNLGIDIRQILSSGLSSVSYCLKKYI